MAYKLINRLYAVTAGQHVEEFICDSDADVATLPQCGPGSQALVPVIGKLWVVNASGQWVEFGSEG